LSRLKANTTYHYRVIASNTAGVTSGGDMTFRTARDVTKPKVSVTVKRQRASRVRTRGLVYLARCSEHCTGTAELVIGKSLARRLHLPVVLGKARVGLEGRPKSSTLRVRVGRRAKKRLASISRTFGATLRLRVADDSHNRATIQRRLKLLRSAP
jgi:hypothetical protein